MEGLIYKVQSYLENDRLLFVYSPTGFITLIAKGAQKLTAPSRSLAQYLTLIEFEAKPHKKMYLLKSAKLLFAFEKIKADFKDLTIASILFDLLKFVSDEEDHESVFKLLKGALLNFSLTSVLSFGFKLLNFIGHPLNLMPDGRKVKGFNLSNARLVYKDERMPIDLDLKQTTSLLKLSAYPYDKIEKIEETILIKLKSFMYQYYEYHTDMKIKRK